MAQEVVGIKIVVDGKEQILTSLGDVKKALKSAQEEAQILAAAGQEGSDKFEKAAARVNQLKKAVEDGSKAVKQFTAEQKFDAVLGSVQGIAGAFSAVQGAIGLVGVESKDVEKTLLKVQSALSVSEGLKSVKEAYKSFGDLGKQLGITSAIQKIYAVTTTLVSSALRLVGINATTASVGVKAFSGALVATGIGAVVVGLGYLASSFISTGNAADEAAEKAKKLKEQLEGIDDAIKNSQGYADRQVRLIKNEEKLKDLQLNSSKNQDEIDKTRKQILDDKLTGIKVELEAKKGLLSNEEKLRLESEKYRLEQDQRRVALEKNAKAEQDADEKRKKANEKAKADAEKLAAEEEKNRQERFEAEKKANEDIRKAKQENFLLSIKDENERAIKKANIDLINRKLEIDSLNITESQKRQLKLQAEIETGYQIADVNDKIKKEQEEKDKKFADKQKAALDKTVQDAKDATEAKKKLAEQEAQVKIDNAQKSASVLSGLSDLFGKETAAGKATAIAAATINTYLAASQALTGIKKMNPLGATIAIAQAALIVANGLKQVREITKVKVPGGGGGGSVPSTSLISGAAPISPNAPITNTMTQLEQGTINQLGSATNRSYVLETDVTNSQERIRRINRAARLN